MRGIILDEEYVTLLDHSRFRTQFVANGHSLT